MRVRLICRTLPQLRTSPGRRVFGDRTIRRRAQKKASTLLPDPGALTGDALPAAGALHEHVHEAVGHRHDLARLGAGHVTAEPDDCGLAVDADPEAVEDRRIDTLSEVDGLCHLGGLGGPRARPAPAH